MPPRAPTAMHARARLIAVVACCAACTAGPDEAPASAARAAAGVPRAELSLARDPALLLDSADALIARDSSVGLVTVDAGGRPRIRTVRAFRLPNPATPKDRFTVFVLTRLSTRKVEQLAANAHVTLYFNEDQRVTYATVMGRATVHRDPTNPRVQPFLDSGTVRFFWPGFPQDFVMIEVVPEWLEFIGPGLWNDPDTWRPQAVVFDSGSPPS